MLSHVSFSSNSFLVFQYRKTWDRLNAFQHFVISFYWNWFVFCLGFFFVWQFILVNDLSKTIILMRNILKLNRQTVDDDLTVCLLFRFNSFITYFEIFCVRRNKAFGLKSKTKKKICNFPNGYNDHWSLITFDCSNFSYRNCL